MTMKKKYRQAYRRWKKIRDLDVDAAGRLSREEAHARGGSQPATAPAGEAGRVDPFRQEPEEFGFRAGKGRA